MFDPKTTAKSFFSGLGVWLGIVAIAMVAL